MKYNRHNKAFTLAEVILAIGIMGIGMVFAACLFPAAIKESESSSAAMEGSIIAQNGLNTAQQMLTSSNVGGGIGKNKTVGNFVWIDGNVLNVSDLSTSALGFSGFFPSTSNLASPPATLPNAGYVLLLQHQSGNEYLAIAVSYRKRKGGNIEVTSASCSLGGMEEKVNATSDADKFQRNGIVIVDAVSSNSTAGKMARIINRKNNEVTIEHPLSTSSTSNLIVITESGSLETPVLSATSAIITIN